MPAGQTANQGTFGESAIDLTALGVLSGETCQTYTTSGFLTKTGNSNTAQLVDYSGFANPLTLGNCNGLSVSKVSTASNFAPATPFTYRVDQVDGRTVHDGALAGTNQSGGALTDQDGAVTSITHTITVGDTHTWSPVQAQSDYRVSELTPLPAGWTLQTIVCSYTDLFAPAGSQSKTATIYQNGAYTGQTFEIFPSTTGAPAPSCVITNAATGLVLNKVVTNDNGGTATIANFPLQATGAGPTVVINGVDPNPDPAIGISAQVAPGTYALSETPLAGYLAGNWSCVDQAGAVVTTTATGPGAATITVGAGQVVTCLLSNNDVAPTLTVTKSVLNQHGGTLSATDFPLFLNGGSVVTGVPTSVTAGVAYTPTETQQTGYVQTSIVCSDNQGGAVLAQPVVLAPGQNATCVISNTDIAPVVSISKTVSGVDPGLAWSFQFSISPTTGVTGANPQSVSGTGNSTSATAASWLNLTGGVQYTITEVPIPGWQASLTCSGTTVITSGSGSVTFTASIGENIVCSATNSAVPATVSVSKSVTGVAASLPWSFDFSISPSAGLTGASPQSIAGTGSTTSAATATWAGLIPGATYTITEAAQAGWTATSFSCTGVTDTDSNPATVTFVAGLAQTIVCSASNAAAPASVSVSKSVTGVDASLAWSFDFSISPTAGVTGASPQTLSGTGSTTSAATASWSGLTPGATYTITEAAQAGWTPSFSCTGVTDTDSNPATVTFVAGVGQTIVCSATNAATPASVSVSKSVTGVDASLAWSFDFSISPTAGVIGASPQSIAGTGSTTSAATASWSGLIPGTTYTITEAAVAGWTTSAFSCTGVTDTDQSPSSVTFVAGVGQTIVCSASNAAAPASVSVSKSVTGVDASLAWSFDFSISPTAGVTGASPQTLSGTGSTTSAATASWSGLIPGATYTITEAAVAGWTPSFSCTGVTDTDSNAATVTFVAGVGQTIVCSATNAATPASVSVSKSVTGVDASLAWSFDFSISPTTGVTGASPQTLSGTGSTTSAAAASWTGLTPGTTYTITEAAQAGWTPSFSCTGITDLDSNPATVTFVAGLAQTIVCSATNAAAPASVSVSKSVTGVDASQAWSFDFSISPTAGVTGASPQTLSGTGNTTSAATATWSGLTPGTTYTITEAAQAGWTASLSCTGVTDTDSNPATVTFVAGVGQTIVCSATNAATPASVSVSKSVTGVDASLAWSFDFSISPTTGLTGASPQSIAGTGSTTSAATASWSGLTPGATYTITEAAQAGWTTSAFSCTGVTDTDQSPSSVTFVAGVGQQVVCSATNAAAPASVSVSKSVTGVDASLAWSFDFSISPTAGVTGASPQSIAGTGSTTSAATASWSGLIPGATYTITEAAQAGWTPSFSCTGITDLDSNPATVTFVAGVGQTLVCSATNAAASASVSVSKSVTGADASLAWSFGFSISPTTGLTGASPQTLSGTGRTTSAVTASWSGLVPGATYTITEAAVAGWTTTSFSCTGVTDTDQNPATVTFVAGVGQSIVCSASNAAAPASVSVSKSVTGVDASLAWSFDFSISPTAGVTGASPQSIAGTGSTTSAATASWSGLIPGATYTITEAAQAGWTPSFSCTGITDLDSNPATVTFVAGVAQALVCSAANSTSATLVVRKVVINDNGGNLTAADFALTVNGAPAVQGAVVTVPVGLLHEVAEAPVAGYAGIGAVCVSSTGRVIPPSGSALIAVVPGPGEQLECTLTNDDVPPGLTVVKQVSNIHGGGLSAGDFPLTVNGATVTTDVATVPTANIDLVIAETQQAGYTALSTVCVSSIEGSANAKNLPGPGGATVNLRPGEYVTCVITNQDLPVDLELTKSDGGITAVAGGAPFDYTLTVRNVGERNVDSGEPVTVTDVLPAQFAWVAAPAGCSIAGQVLTCTIDPALLPAGGSPVVIVATVAARPETPAGTYTNVATVTTRDDPACAGEGCEPPVCPESRSQLGNVACDDTPVTTSADVSIVKTASVGSAPGGTSFTWTLVVRNAGPSIAVDVAVVDEVPSPLVVTGASSAAMTCVVEGNRVACAAASLPVGGTATILITVSVPATASGGTVVNTGTVTSTTPDPDRSNNTSSARVDIPAPMLAETGAQVTTVTGWGVALTGAGLLLLLGAARRRA